MRFTIITARLPRMPFPSLEDIGAAMMAVPSPSGHTFESFIPHLDDDEPIKKRVTKLAHFSRT